MTAPAARPRVLLPRPGGREDALPSLLRARGLEPEQHPFVELVPERDTDLREAVADLAAGSFAWLVLTSATTLTALAFFDGSAESGGVRLAVPASTRVAVVGRSTAEAARAAGIAPDLVAEGSGRALVAEMPPAHPGQSVLFPASSAAAPTVPDGLRERGYVVRQEIAYRPRATTVDPAVVRALASGGYGAIVLTSSMIARLAAALPIHLSTRVVTIGAPTTAAAHEAGLRVDAQADDPSPDALAAAVAGALGDDLPKETP